MPMNPIEQWVCNDCTHSHMFLREGCWCGCQGTDEQRVAVKILRVPRDEFDRIFARYAESTMFGAVLQIDTDYRFNFLTTNGTLVIVSMLPD